MGDEKCKSDLNPSTSSCIYVLGIIGAAVYYIPQAAGFWPGVVGFLKALVWPAFLVYGLLKLAGM